MVTEIGHGGTQLQEGTRSAEANMVPTITETIFQTGRIKPTWPARVRLTAPVNLNVLRKSGSIDAVLGEVVTQRALADPHHFGRFLLHASGLLQRTPDRFAFYPFEVLMKPHRRESRRWR